MVIKKVWLHGKRRPSGALVEWEREGWFLFGFLPLYVRDLGPRARIMR